MSKIGVKFIEGGKIYNIEVDNLELQIGDKLVVESVRGIELATVSKVVADEEQEEVKCVLRKATAEDLQKAKDLKVQESKIEQLANNLIDKYKLEMKLVDVSLTLDGLKVVISYVSEDRVDFRELVKDLASQLKLRIELKQIGIRDQAKILGGIGFCGNECCCKKYLNDFDKVSIKMAKTQGLSLNPTKISGICGRLMCCLSYENDFYSEIVTKMPKINSRVKTKDGTGVVVYNNILAQKVTVRIESENEVKISEYEISDIELLNKAVPQPVKNSVEEKTEVVKELVSEKGDSQNQDSKSKNFHKFKKKKNHNKDRNETK